VAARGVGGEGADPVTQPKVVAEHVRHLRVAAAERVNLPREALLGGGASPPFVLRRELPSDRPPKDHSWPDGARS
jgi:hypothetical protein